MLTPEQAAARRYDGGRTVALEEVEETKNGWTLHGDHSGFGLSSEHDVTPKVGDVIRLYTYRGSMIRGMDLNGEPIFYKTDYELERDHAKHVEERERDLDRKFEEERARMDAEFDALPDIFKRRIEWFRAHAPRFRQDFEGYEMSACRDAVKLAEWARGQEDPAAAIKEFQDESWERQREIVPGLAYDQHSGNSFGFAVGLAFHYVTVPENVYQEHGAMVPLVGCEEYGCAHPREPLDR